MYLQLVRDPFKLGAGAISYTKFRMQMTIVVRRPEIHIGKAPMRQARYAYVSQRKIRSTARTTKPYSQKAITLLKRSLAASQVFKGLIHFGLSLHSRLY